MKLQLNENTLNAYINEAIRQELNEAFRVDFEKLGTPTGPVKNGWGFARLYTRPERAKKAMASGTYGRTGMMTPKEFVNDLKALGYDTEQIQNGIQNGAIKIGRNFGSGPAQQFLPHNNLRKQNRRDARLRTAAGMPVSNSQSNKTQDDNQTETNNGGFNGTFPWDDTEPQWTPKPTRKPQPQPAQEEPQQPERRSMETLQPVSTINIPTGVTGTSETLPGLKQRPESFVDSARRVMAQTAAAGLNGNTGNPKLDNWKQTNRNTRRTANAAIDTMRRDGAITRNQARQDKRTLRDTEKTIRRSAKEMQNQGQ